MGNVREKILLVEDEEDIVEIIRFHLERENYDFTCAPSGEQVRAIACSWRPDLIILDLMLPGIDGFSLCRILKNDPATSAIPIIMLTAKTEEIDVLLGLELGADDYITKPFSMRILLARIKTVLRRKMAPVSHEEDLIHVGDLIIDPGRHQVSIHEEPIALTPTEFKIIQLLAKRPGMVFTRYQIIDSAMGEDIEVIDRTVDVHILSLRKKLGAYGNFIETVRGVGYRFKG